MPEAQLEDIRPGAGLAPTGEGWFVVNARDAWWGTSEGLGFSCMFENWGAGFPQLGIRLVVLEPGTPNAVYHSESQQEAFLVLSGECKLIVEGKERLLRAWDFVHCPAGTAHVFVGAGEAASVILTVGARTEDEQVLYPVSELAAKYGASVEEETTDPDQAYARFGPPELARPPSWATLPWAE